MTDEQWKKLKVLYTEARKLDSSTRAAFLTSQCGGDEELLRQAELLLEYGDKAEAESFLEGHAAEKPSSGFWDDQRADLPAQDERSECKPGAELKRDSAQPQERAQPSIEEQSIDGSWTGRTISNYVVAELIGVGGMGEVYRAKDRKLGRDVAFKVLPASFVEDPNRRMRFEREARVLAALNHPHIAAIYGFEEVGNDCALVLELVDGPTLADMLKSGPIPRSEALRIARQLADALEAAHAKNIIHRDLKPANIKIAPSGTVKVLDFGLAKALTAEHSSPSLSQAPTGTGYGVVLGTPAYMSPEQASGQTETLDTRTDIWSFGCVLYEMLSGRRTFPGDSVAETLGSVLGREPDWTALPASMPETVRSLLRRCLAKDPKQRMHHIADARVELDHILSAPDGSPERSPVGLPRIVGIAAVAALVVIGGYLALKSGLNISSNDQTNRTLELTERQITSNPIEDPIAFAAISPDGAFVAYNDSTAIRIRRIDTGETRALTVPPGFCYI
jgi:serine/threonine-protein kinase